MLTCVANAPDSASNIVSLSSSADGELLGVATTHGFAIFELYPELLELRRRSVDGGINLIALHARSSAVVLVRRASPSTCLLFDNSCEAEARGDDPILALLDLRHNIVCVKLHASVIAIGLETNEVLLFNDRLVQCCLIRCHFVSPNCVAMPAVSMGLAQTQMPVAVVGADQGKVELYGLVSTGVGQADADETFIKKKTVDAHDKNVEKLVMSSDGELCFSVSTGGTAIKVIDVAQGVIRHQLNRGQHAKLVPGIACKANNALAACVSESGTLHVYALRQVDDVTVRNPGTFYASVPGVSGTVSTVAAVLGGSLAINAQAFISSEDAFAHIELPPAFYSASLVALLPRSEEGRSLAVVVNANTGAVAIVTINAAAASDGCRCVLREKLSLLPPEPML